MLYLLDANVLIRAHEDYYPIDRVPQFWEWLLIYATAGSIKLPYEIHAEIANSKGDLHDWVTDSSNAKKLILDAHADPDDLNKVLADGYAPDLNDSEIEKVGRDPFLVAYALPFGADVTVVTKEVSAPSKQRANRKVPDVCAAVGVQCIKDFDLYRALDFRTR